MHLIYFESWRSGIKSTMIGEASTDKEAALLIMNNIKANFLGLDVKYPEGRVDIFDDYGAVGSYKLIEPLSIASGKR